LQVLYSQKKRNMIS